MGDRMAQSKARSALNRSSDIEPADLIEEKLSNWAILQPAYFIGKRNV
jgi:hypothetical protein